MNENTIIGYNHFLLDNNPLNIFRGMFIGDTIEPLITDFCKPPNPPPSSMTSTKTQSDENTRLANALKENADYINGLNGTGEFTRNTDPCIIDSNGNRNCYFCDSNGNCYYCTYVDGVIVSCQYYSKSKMDSMKNKGFGSYIVDKLNLNNIFKVGTIGNTADNGLVSIEGFDSTIKLNTGETERYSNILYIYNKLIIHVINLGLGILCLLLIIQYLRRV